jgi:hypothetical protein
MIKITIGNKHYSGVYSWEDITLYKFSQLSDIPMPEAYKAYILADGKYDHDKQETVNNYLKVVTSMTDKQLKEEFPAYHRKVCKILSDVPDDLLSDDLVERLYMLYFKPFVFTLVYHCPVIHFAGKLIDYRPEDITSFKVKGERYYLPESVQIMDITVPLKNETISAYLDASDVFREMELTSRVKKLALFMAIYCRKKYEVYDERLTLERQDLFMTLPMSTIWAVFFCIARRLPSFSINTLLFGDLPKSLTEIVLEARTLKNTALVG